VNGIESVKEKKQHPVQAVRDFCLAGSVLINLKFPHIGFHNESLKGDNLYAIAIGNILLQIT
jgi:hypothetical protein